MRHSRIRRHSIALLCAAACGTSLIATTVQAQLPTSITYFGDSFLDSGNGDIIAATLGIADPTPSPPYAPGRISNGPNWADYLSSSFGFTAAPSLLGGRNFAIGTARTGLTGANALPLGMLSQYGQQSSAAADPTGLYVLFGGSNDILDAAQLANPAAREMALQTAVGNIATIVQGLYAQGARRFLLPNIPDVGKAPVALGSPAASILTAATQRFNTLLAQRMAVLAGALPGSSFSGLSLDVLFSNILIDAAQGGARYGLTNATTPCLVAPVPCNTAVFADPLHPSTGAHAIIANAAFNRIVNQADVAPVPEPATVVLMGAGLLLVGAFRRERGKRAARRS